MMTATDAVELDLVCKKFCLVLNSFLAAVHLYP